MIFDRQFAFEFSILVILSTAALFFFPAVHGSYTAVHGPVTALRWIKSRVHVWLTLMLAAFGVAEVRRWGYARALGTLPHGGVLLRPSHSECTTVYRC